MKTIHQKISIVAFSAIVIGFVFWSAVFIYKSSLIAIDHKRYFSLFDDAMISMRYAWNFSHGYGLVWNPGERVEGYSNLLLVLIMSLVTWLLDKPSAVLSIQIFGIITMLGIAYISTLILNLINKVDGKNSSEYLKPLSFLAVLAYYPLVYWSLMGMETGLLTLIILFSVLMAIRYNIENKPNYLYHIGWSLGLAYLTRNDSAIFSSFILFYVAVKVFHHTRDGGHIRPFLVACMIYLVFIVAQSIFRYEYYHALTPNTYMLKIVGIPIIPRIKDGFRFILPFLEETSFILIVPTIGIIKTPKKEKLLFLSMLFISLTYQIFAGGDPWNYWRIMAPSMPLLIVLFLNTIISMRLIDGIIRSKGMLLNIKIILLAIGFFWTNSRFLGEISFVNNLYQEELNHVNINTAIALIQATTPNATIGVIHAGTIPYYTGRKSVDFLGKMDKYIAQLPPDFSGEVGWNGLKSVPGHNKYDLNYSIKFLRPTYVQYFFWGRQDLTQWAKTRYVQTSYLGIPLKLLKDSPEVFWERLSTPSIIQTR